MPYQSLQSSVIIPTFQSQKHIEEAVVSILTQEVAVDEIVVSDDGSTDQTLAILEKLSENSKIPIRIHRNPNPCGPTENYLHAISQVGNADIILISDHDDAWLPNRTRCILDSFASDPHATVICCDSYLVNQDLQNHTGKDNTSRGGIKSSRKLCEEVNQHDSLKAYLAGRIPWPAHALSFRASIVPLLLQRPDQMYWWDFEEFLVAVGATIGNFKLIPEALTLYRIHETQATHQHKENPFLNSLRFRTSNYYLQAINLEQRISKLRYCQSILQNAQNPERKEYIQEKLSTIEDALYYHNIA